jgi:hypothetical protein
MIETCKKCEKTRDGDKYMFYHGNTAGETVQYAGSRNKRVTRRYSNMTMASYFVCNMCIRQRITRNLLIIIGLVGLTITVWLLQLSFRTFGQSNLVCLALIIPIVVLAFGFMYLHLKKKDVGEEVAIEIGRKEFPKSDAFFNSVDYENLTIG